jgi:methylmalonyl-CoA/ethylmalonyl-CoA epimerase
MNTAAMKFNHLGVAVASIEQALPLYRDVFGYQVLSGPFQDPVQKVSVCFLGSGSQDGMVVEVVEPLGEESPVHRTLQKGAGAAYHVCYEVDDIEQALHDVRAEGCIIVAKPVSAVAFDGRRIAWFYTPHRELIELVER